MWRKSRLGFSAFTLHSLSWLESMIQIWWNQLHWSQQQPGLNTSCFPANQVDWWSESMLLWAARLILPQPEWLPWISLMHPREFYLRALFLALIPIQSFSYCGDFTHKSHCSVTLRINAVILYSPALCFILPPMRMQRDTIAALSYGTESISRSGAAA